MNPDDGGVVVNHYELEEDNAYSSVNTPGSSATTSKPPEDSLPPVYAAVDKNNREGKTVGKVLNLCLKWVGKTLKGLSSNINSNLNRFLFFKDSL